MNDDELGELLRADLHAIGQSIEPTSKFWDRVVPASSPGPERAPRPFRRRFLAPMVVTFAVVAAVLVLILGGSRTPAAYAVTIAGDSVKVTLNQVTAITGLNRELKRLDVPVRAVRMAATCPTRLDLTYIGEEARPSTLQLTRGRQPKGVTVIIGAEQDGPDHVTFAIGKVRTPPPACVYSNGPGPRVPDLTTTTH